MGRKSEKSLAKKKEKKEEKAKLMVSLDLIKKANSLEDPLAELAVFHTYRCEDQNINLQCKKVSDLSKDTIDWAFDLTKRNVQKLYEESKDGWNGTEKYEEMTHSAAWYLIARKSDLQVPVAFSHFRFDLDFDDEVLYVYEIQVEESERGQGLGKFMMQALELMAFRNNMLKIMLTVFKHNPRAMQFFRRLKYEVDETSLEDSVYEQYDYEIWSKVNKRRALIPSAK